MPNAALTITPVNPHPIQDQGKADQPFLDVGIDLDETFSIHMQAQLDRIIGFVHGDNPLNIGPLVGHLLHVALKLSRSHGVAHIAPRNAAS